MRLLLLSLLVLSGCASTKGVRSGASVLLTDETATALSQACRDHEGEFPTPVSRDDPCQCLGKTRWGALQEQIDGFCGERGELYYQRLRATMRDEGEAALKGSDGRPPTARVKDCARTMAELRIDGTYGKITKACEVENRRELALLTSFGDAAAPGGCWRMTHMTVDGCIAAEPCIGRGPAAVAALPLTPQAAAAVPDRVLGEGDRVELCHPDVQRLHQLKDPKGANRLYNYAFVNYLSFNKSYANLTYGPANCHGTAQALSGDFLGSVPVPHIGFHSPEVAQQCGEAARVAYGQATAGSSGATPIARDLPIGRGGYSINMRYGGDCSADQCGAASMQVFSCSQSDLLAYIMIEGMCVQCWSKHLEQAGKLPLDQERSTGRDLKPGCVMTGIDHSITVVMNNDGLCYYYEALSPFAAPQINVAECSHLLTRYSRAWCPVEPLAFGLRLTRP